WPGKRGPGPGREKTVIWSEVGVVRCETDLHHIIGLRPEYLRQSIRGYVDHAVCRQISVGSPVGCTSDVGPVVLRVVDQDLAIAPPVERSIFLRRGEVTSSISRRRVYGDVGPAHGDVPGVGRIGARFSGERHMTRGIRGTYSGK